MGRGFFEQLATRSHSSITERNGAGGIGTHDLSNAESTIFRIQNYSCQQQQMSLATLMLICHEE